LTIAAARFVSIARFSGRATFGSAAGAVLIFGAIATHFAT